jgi:hypothetical protein
MASVSLFVGLSRVLDELLSSLGVSEVAVSGIRLHDHSQVFCDNPDLELADSEGVVKISKLGRPRVRGAREFFWGGGD